MCTLKSNNFLMVFGLVLEKLGDLDKAKNEFEMAKNLDSKNEEAQQALKDLKKKM